LLAKRNHGIVSQFDLSNAEDPGIAGQDLRDERRAGSRQPHNEHWYLAFRPEAAEGIAQVVVCLGKVRLELRIVIDLASGGPSHVAARWRR
jgi:hypothetical protein